MKKGRNIFSKIIFLMTVFLCLGINVHSEIPSPQYEIEFSSCTTSVENSIRPEIDSIDEDQIDQISVFGLSEDPICQISIPMNCSPINYLCFSVWQPPKIS
jgi:hypothetical protein